MNSNNVLDFFYKKVSERIRKRIEETKLKLEQVHKSDPKQISRIVHKKITRNNPYLINDSTISSSYVDDITGEVIPCGLLETEELGFKSRADILWGTKEEISLYIEDFFSVLLEELSNSYSSYNIDIEMYLCDYVPYAKYYSYWNILFSPENKYPAIAYSIYEDDVIENIDTARKNAIAFLFCKLRLEFEQNFYQFTRETTSFHKIDKVFQKTFLENYFIPMLKKYAPNNTSLGLRVFDLINADLSHCASLFFNPTIDNFNYRRRLNHASCDYISALEEVQKLLY